MNERVISTVRTLLNRQLGVAAELFATSRWEPLRRHRLRRQVVEVYAAIRSIYLPDAETAEVVRSMERETYMTERAMKAGR